MIIIHETADLDELHPDQLVCLLNWKSSFSSFSSTGESNDEHDSNFTSKIHYQYDGNETKSCQHLSLFHMIWPVMTPSIMIKLFRLEEQATLLEASFTVHPCEYTIRTYHSLSRFSTSGLFPLWICRSSDSLPSATAVSESLSWLFLWWFSFSMALLVIKSRERTCHLPAFWKTVLSNFTTNFPIHWYRCVQRRSHHGYGTDQLSPVPLNFPRLSIISVSTDINEGSLSSTHLVLEE